MDYLPGQYGMHYERIGLNDYHFDSLGLAGHRPYYAFAGNQLATGEQGSNGNYYWMQQQHSGQHLIGQKQYELTNHLGNVQVTVSDLPYKHENDTMTHISPALKAVYDYYPFGSPMPGRTVMDTARKCVDMTRLDRVWKAWEMTMTEIYALSLINYHLDGEGEVFIDDNGAVEVETADEHAVFYMELQDSLNNGGEMVLHVDWLKEFSEKGFQLYVQGLDAAGEMRVFYQKYYENPEDVVYLSIADSFTNVSVGIQGALHFGISNIRYFGGSWVNEEVLVRVCYDGGDRYRFGFNGQEKVNEISGMGNHNTAEFWEYDTRLGRRWNLDPVDQISVSNYAVNGNNPIWAYDALGNFDSNRTDDSDEINSIGGISPPSSNDRPFGESDYGQESVREDKGGLKSSDNYDYSREEIPEKMKEDFNYIFKGEKGTILGRWWNTFVRDWKAVSIEEKIDFAVTVATAPLGGRKGMGAPKAAKGGGKSVNQLNKAVQTGKAPKGIIRFDKGRGTKNLPQDEVHFKDGSSLYRDGTWRHNKGHNLTNDQIKFLKENGWNIP